MNIQQIMIELGIAVSYSLSYVYLLDIDQEIKEKIQWAGIILVIVCMGINFGFTLLYLVKDIVRRIRAYRNRNCRVDPDTKIDNPMNRKIITNEPDTSTFNMNLDDSHDTSTLPINMNLDDASPHVNNPDIAPIPPIFFSRLHRRKNLKSG
jgi:hypothetical protein